MLAKRTKAKVAELVDALDSKSSPAHPGCRFESDLWYCQAIGVKSTMAFSRMMEPDWPHCYD
jgi:hypothetical protein